MCPPILANFGFVAVLRMDEKKKTERRTGLNYRSQNWGQPVAGVWYFLEKLFSLMWVDVEAKKHVSIFENVPAGVWYSMTVATVSSWSEQHANGKTKK